MPKVGNRHFPYTKSGRRMAAEERKKRKKQKKKY